MLLYIYKIYKLESYFSLILCVQTIVLKVLETLFFLIGVIKSRSYGIITQEVLLKDSIVDKKQRRFYFYAYFI